MSHAQIVFVNLLAVIFIVTAFVISVASEMRLRKQCSPGTRNRPVRYSIIKLRSRRLTIISLLWSGFLVCTLIVQKDPDLRFFMGMMGLFFLLMVWASTRMPWLNRYMRNKWFRPDSGSTLRLKN